MSRPYVKKSDYWEQPRKPVTLPPQPITVNNITQSGPVVDPKPFPEINFGSMEIETPMNKEARASSNNSPPTTYRGSQVNSGTYDLSAFQNIKAMSSPLVGFTGNREYAGMQDAIDLCVRAWSGVPVVRNAIEVSVEFSCQPIYIKSKNLTVQTFYREWWNAIGGPKLLRQAMRSYYREGQAFWYVFMGKFGPAYYKNLQQSFGKEGIAIKENKIPIRYELLNPMNVFVPNGLGFPYTYVRMLSTYEIARLRNPLTEQDKQVYRDLPDVVKAQLKAGGVNPQGIFIPMAQDRLRFMFYKKQDFEPLAVPMVWPVLPDVEWKLALKKMDMELARKIEHAMLIITTGEAPNQWNGGNGINQNNIARLQNLFSNQTIMRVLVGDYTLKANWTLPDVKEILGPEKYTIVDKDIKEGLQSILTGDDKFANALMKAKVFIQRLEEGQQAFLDEFLMIEIQRIGETMGFRDLPEVGFRKIDLQDETVMARIMAQLAQIGVLTAPQAVQAIETGILPDANEMQVGQEEYTKNRKKGLYEPLVGGQKDDGTVAGRPAGSKTPKSKVKVGPIGKGEFSVKAYVEHLKASQKLETEVQRALCKKFKIKELNETQWGVAQTLVKTIVAMEPKDNWIKSVGKTLESLPEIPAEIGNELDELSSEYQVDSMDAALLRWCRVE